VSRRRELLRRGLVVAAVAASAVLALLPRGEISAAGDSVAFVGVTVLDGVGGTQKDRTVVVEGGKIRAIGTAVPAGARRIEVKGGVLSPGLIDASTSSGVRRRQTEITREMTADLDVTDQVDPRSSELLDAARAGVTSVCITPGTRNVVGGRSRVFHARTRAGKAEPIAKTERALHIGMNGTPSSGNFPPRRGPTTSIYARRPTTRMGVVWMLRQVFLAAKGDQEMPNPADLRVYREVLDGKRDVRVRASRNQDVVATLRIADEVGFTPIFEGGEEAYMSRRELAKRKLTVILGPQPHVRSGTGTDFTETALSNAALLKRAGLRVVLSSDRSGARRLRDQAILARRFGLSSGDALAAVTSVPAALLGMKGRGEVKVGNAADLVLWSTDPLSPAARPLVVMVDGAIVHQEKTVR